jgi:hypothetical protein
MIMAGRSGWGVKPAIPTTPRKTTMDMNQMPQEGGDKMGEMKEKLAQCMALMEEMMGMMGGEGDEGDDMAAAEAGYAKKARPAMSAPNPQGIFGE